MKTLLRHPFAHGPGVCRVSRCGRWRRRCGRHAGGPGGAIPPTLSTRVVRIGVPAGRRQFTRHRPAQLTQISAPRHCVPCESEPPNRAMSIEPARLRADRPRSKPATQRQLASQEPATPAQSLRDGDPQRVAVTNSHIRHAGRWTLPTALNHSLAATGRVRADAAHRLRAREPPARVRARSPRARTPRRRSAVVAPDALTVPPARRCVPARHAQPRVPPRSTPLVASPRRVLAVPDRHARRTPCHRRSRTRRTVRRRGSLLYILELAVRVRYLIFAFW
jgi:hypothetical protein